MGDGAPRSTTGNLPWIGVPHYRASRCGTRRSRRRLRVQLCRSTRNPGNGLRNALSTYLEASLESVLELNRDQEAFGEHAVAVGNLWTDAEALLRPCFGFFPPDAWVTQFEAGRGIAGHAFRFARPAAWHRSITGEFDVIRVPTMTGTRDYE
jgi:hypothetical protein